MSENSKIQWTDHTFNPWRGCAKVHDGCANCYAERDAKRFPGKLGVWGQNGTRIKASAEMWGQPVKWNKASQASGVRAKVFCASIADVFEDWTGPIHDHNGKVLTNATIETAGPSSGPLTMDDLRRDLFALIDATPWLDWLLLTKRPENIWRMWPDNSIATQEQTKIRSTYGPRYRPNVWLGTSISLQSHAEKQIPQLLKLSDIARVLFLSIEPLMGPIQLQNITTYAAGSTSFHRNVLSGDEFQDLAGDGGGIAKGLPHIDWAIVGGESGPGARPCEVAWIRSIRDQCKAAGAPVFIKQMGAHCLDTVSHGDGPVSSRVRLSDSKGGDWNEWPIDLRVREFPTESRENETKGGGR